MKDCVMSKLPPLPGETGDAISKLPPLPGGEYSHVGASQALGTSELVKPPIVLFLVSFFVLLFTACVFIAPGIDFPLLITDRSGDRNLLGFLAGSFLNTAILGVFLKEDNARRSTLRYVDSRISPRFLVPLFTLSSWFLGLLHMFFFAKELTRA